MGIRIWAGQQPFANAGPGPTRLLKNESCEWPLSALCSRWVTTRRMGEDAPKQTLVLARRQTRPADERPRAVLDVASAHASARRSVAGILEPDIISARAKRRRKWRIEQAGLPSDRRVFRRERDQHRAAPACPGCSLLRSHPGAGRRGVHFVFHPGTPLRNDAIVPAQRSE